MQPFGSHIFGPEAHAVSWIRPVSICRRIVADFGIWREGNFHNIMTEKGGLVQFVKSLYYDPFRWYVIRYLDDYVYIRTCSFISEVILGNMLQMWCFSIIVHQFIFHVGIN